MGSVLPCLWYVCSFAQLLTPQSSGAIYVLDNDRLPPLPLEPGTPPPKLEVMAIVRHLDSDDNHNYVTYMDDKALYQFTKDDHPPIEGDRKYITQGDIKDGDYGDECHDLESLQMKGYIDKPPPVLRTWSFDPADAPHHADRKRKRDEDNNRDDDNNSGADNNNEEDNNNTSD
jgi:hypothetical protein